jgi:epoxide hydrolase 4
MRTRDWAGAGVRRRADGVMLNVIEAGPEQGPLVILLHGFPDFWWGWRRQIGPLSDTGLRVLAPDQRGYNLSDKPRGLSLYHVDQLAADVIGLMTTYGRRSVRLVGHDWGGLVAWWTACLYPDAVERLAVLNAPHPAVVGSYMRDHPGQVVRSSYIGFFQIPWLPEAALRFANYALLRQSLLRSSRAGTFAEKDLSHYEEAWSQAGALESMLAWYRALRQFNPKEREAPISPEVLILWGRHDLALESGLAEASLKLCRRGRLQWLEASHWVHLEEWRTVNEALVAFLT